MNEASNNAEAAKLRRRIEEMIAAEENRKFDQRSIRRDRNDRAAYQVMGYGSTLPLAVFGLPGNTTVGP